MLASLLRAVFWLTAVILVVDTAGLA
ncbi:MAG: hypothetical protein RLZZ272_1466, partial [Actinomycetota bacterium]